MESVGHERIRADAVIDRCFGRGVPEDAQLSATPADFDAFVGAVVK